MVFFSDGGGGGEEAHSTDIRIKRRQAAAEDTVSD